MHPLSGGYGGYGLENQQSPQEAGSPQQDPSGGNGAVGEGQNGSGPNYSDINQILDQILNITDQSLDEAQVCWFHEKKEYTYVCMYYIFYKDFEKMIMRRSFIINEVPN